MEAPQTVPVAAERRPEVGEARDRVSEAQGGAEGGRVWPLQPCRESADHPGWTQRQWGNGGLPHLLT